MKAQATATHGRRGTVRILVADADEHARSHCRAVLSGEACSVVEAADGREAMANALSKRPTLVIIDSHLPFFDGYALCEVLRCDVMTRTVPILVVTTETRRSEWDRARAAGADAVLLKPAAPDVLLKEIQRLLARTADAMLPTRVGDVLILQTERLLTVYAVGRVSKDGQQDFRSAGTVKRTNDHAAAVAEAKNLVVRGRRIFSRNLDTGDWSEISK